MLPAQRKRSMALNKSDELTLVEDAPATAAEFAFSHDVSVAKAQAAETRNCAVLRRK
jgi:hypothetical protein